MLPYRKAGKGRSFPVVRLVAFISLINKKVLMGVTQYLWEATTTMDSNTNDWSSRMFEEVKYRLVGNAALILHNGHLADPMNHWAREIKRVSSKRGKTDEDLMELRRIEWEGGLYLDDKNRVVIHGDNILATVIEGAKKSKEGPKAKAGVLPGQTAFLLEYDGPKDLDKLYEDGRFVDYRPVGVNRVKVMRSRPIFREWAVDISLHVETDIMDIDRLDLALTNAGRVCGLGDFRPRYGRFTAERS